MLKQYEHILSEYRKWYPNLYDQTAECRPSGKHMILVTLTDNTKLEYNSLDNTIRDVTKLYSSDFEKNINEDDWRKEFGRKLRKAITSNGISQERLSEMSGISRQMLTRYVRGTSTPSGYVLAKLANILGSDIREFTRFGYIDEE